jgi:hypothetical protein
MTKIETSVTVDMRLSGLYKLAGPTAASRAKERSVPALAKQSVNLNLRRGHRLRADMGGSFELRRRRE